jgi:V/A-type H+-transporting ATPase subunit E
MSNLDNLIHKIQLDCETQVNAILDAAYAEASDIVARYGAEAEAAKEAILGAASIEADRTAERVTLEKRLEIRDDILCAKHEMLSKIFALALSQLRDLPKSDYLDFVNANLKGINADIGVLVVPEAYGIGVSDLAGSGTARNGDAGRGGAECGDAGRGGAERGDATVSGISISNDRHVNSGFIFVDGDIEYNFTFEALLERRRHELESDLIKLLW